MKNSPHVLIAGAGIAGLITALALLKRGIKVDVYEQADKLMELGAGIQVGPNGSRVLIDLGLEAAMQKVVCEATAKEVRIWNTGETTKLFDLGRDCIERFGSPYWMAHRGDFHRLLVDAVMAADPNVIHTGSRVIGQTQANDKIALQFADGRPEVIGDVAIGCDGVHSPLRASAGVTDKTSFTGLMAWRGLVSAEKLSAEARRPVGVNWVGPGGHVITYPLRGGSLLNFVGIVEGVNWSVESWTETGTTEECLSSYKNWHPIVHEFINNIDQPFKWALLGRQPLTQWAYGRLCLMGDAAHPTLPFLAQGANMAIEDGLLLARCIEAGHADLPAALTRFEGLRTERTSNIVRRSSEMANTFHNPKLADHASAVEYVNREWAVEKVKVRYDWLYEYDPRTVDVTPLQAA